MTKVLSWSRKMLSINRKILRDLSYAEITRLRTPKLKIKKCLIDKFSCEKKILIKAICGLNKQESYKINKL